MNKTRRETTAAIIRKLQWLDDQELIAVNALLKNMLLTERKKNNG